LFAGEFFGGDELDFDEHVAFTAAMEVRNAEAGEFQNFSGFNAGRDF